MFGRAADSLGWALALCVACGEAEHNPPSGGGGSAGHDAGGSPGIGGAHSGGALASRGGVSATGGTSSGGVSAAGGASSGGANATGGTGSGGVATGGSAMGGNAFGGNSAGGVNSGGASAGGSAEAGTGGALSAGAGGEAGASALCDDYVACGCGCCGAGPSEVGRCYYPEAGDKLSDIIASDQAQHASASCASAGCSAGLRHACCMKGASEPAGGASYSAALLSTALDRISISKTGTDDRCARIGFVAPASVSTVYTALELPTLPGGGTWAMEAAYESACAMSSLPPAAIGAIGTMKLRAEGAGCVVDVHVTTFFARSGGIQSVHFDADELALTGSSSSQCP